MMGHLLGKSLARNANEDPKLDRGKHRPLYIAELQFRYDARLTRAFSERRLRVHEVSLPSDCTDILSDICIGFVGTIKATIPRE
jgi:hypothetical protein